MYRITEETAVYQFAQLDQGETRVCCVLAPRQTGKSSLMARTAKRLEDDGLICIQINLQELGNVESDRALWRTLLQLICQQVVLPEGNLVDRLNSVWKHTLELQASVQFKNFLIEEILTKLKGNKLIIFLDEIQTLINWKLQNTFIGLIRDLSQNHNQKLLRQLNFILLGVAKPSDLLTDSGFAFNLGEQIELGNLEQKDCQPLQQGLEKVTNSPETLLKSILNWTGGQPFLTQMVCHLVASSSKILDNSDVESYVKKIVTNQVIKNWRKQDKQSHLQEIENWFIRGDYSQKTDKLKALSLYKKILNKVTVKFQNSIEQWNLIISGIVVKEQGRLKVTNQIYHQVFNRTWLQETEECLQENKTLMAEQLDLIYNRDVFMLIDQSASMRKKDDGVEKKRWQLLEELVAGHVDSILEIDGEESDKQVCTEIFITTFNVNKFRGSLRRVTDQSQVKDIFYENRPDGNTYVVPTLRKCREQWLAGRNQVTVTEIEAGKAKGAFFIIYTDGQFDDPKSFEDFIKETCLKIDDERIVKVLIIGLGKDINEKAFDALNKNLRGNKDFNGKNCRLVISDLADNLDDGIIPMMQRLYDSTYEGDEWSPINSPKPTFPPAPEFDVFT
ncbi:MAG: AAA-like domain-containing protein [Potamolinea sp.]